MDKGSYQAAAFTVPQSRMLRLTLIPSGGASVCPSGDVEHGIISRKAVQVSSCENLSSLALLAHPGEGAGGRELLRVGAAACR
jgi:hypothetical protein